MKVIVVGGGKVGYYLTKTLLEHGHEPYVIENKRALCKNIANQLDIPVYCGDGTSIGALEGVQAQNADALIAVTGRDEDNLIACQLAKRKFGVKRTVARVNNPKNVMIMKKLGVDIPVSSTDNMARLLEREVDTAAMKQILSLNRGEASLSELEIPMGYKNHGIRLMELDLPGESVIVTITRNGELIIPRGNVQLLEGDELLVVCANTALRELSEKLGLQEKD